MAARIDTDAREREIAKKATALFSKVGFDNVSLQMIARAAGVSRTVIYRHFRNKREVMDAAIHQATAFIMRECNAIREAEPRLDVQLVRICHRTAEILFANKEFLVAVYDFVVAEVRVGEDMTGRVRQFTTGLRDLLVRLLVEGSETGIFRPGLDIPRAADMLYSFLEVCTMRIILGMEETPDEAKHRFSMTIAGLQSVGGRGRKPGTRRPSA